MLPDPFIINAPLRVWLGIVLAIFITLQILIGKKIIKVPFYIHTKIMWLLIAIVGFIHLVLGLQIYF